MIKDEEMIVVSNRTLGATGYNLPELNIQRIFEPGESKKISMNELRSLSYTLGGKYILAHYLIIQDKDAIKEIFNTVEPEYHYTKEDIEKLLVSGSLDQLKDCLDFAPQGVIDMVKDLAVTLEIADINKREAIKKVTEFDVTKAIEINHATADAEEDVEEEAPKRRTAPVKTEESEEPKEKTRRTSKYNVVK